MACRFSFSALGRFLSNTFLAQHVDADDLSRASDSALEFLLKHNFIIVVGYGTARPGREHGDEEDYGVASTQLGQARRLRGCFSFRALQ